MDRIGKYEIIDEIGAGGFGTVYRGRDPILKRMVAIKTCSSEDDLLRQRFRREAEIVAGLQHPNITTIHDLGEQDGVPYLVQEFLDGEDLSHIIGRRDNLSFEQRARLLYGVASGLAHAHANGIIHRDIKPSNVRVLSNGSVKVMDFGIAKIGDVQTELTRTGMMLGTGPYLAPEQLTDEQLDSRCDIFSFGVVAYELFAYQRPFEASTFSALLYKILNQPHTPIRELCPGLSEPLVELVERCLVKDRERRMSSFNEIRSQLAQVLNISEERELPSSSQVFLDPTVAYDSGAARRTTAEPVAQTDENSATLLMSSKEASAAAMREAALRATEEDQPTTPLPKGSGRSLPLAAAAIVVALLAVAGAVWLSRGDTAPPSTEPAPTSELSPPPTVGGAPSQTSAARPTTGEPDPAAATSAASESETPSANDSEETSPARDPEPAPTRTTAVSEPETPPARAADRVVSAAESTPSGSTQTSVQTSVQQSAPASTPPPPEDGSVPSGEPEATETAPASEVAAPGPAQPPPREESTAVADRPPATPQPEAAAPPPEVTPEPAEPDPAVEEAGIRAALDRYRRAYEALDINALATAWPTLDGGSRSQIERAFGSYQALSMTVDTCAFDITGATAVAECVVHQQVTPRGGRQLTSDREVTFRLVKRGDDWVIEDA